MAFFGDIMQKKKKVKCKIPRRIQGFYTDYAARKA